MKYQNAIEKLTSKGMFTIELGLERIKAVLEHFGNPQDSLKCIHVAGTNGKGSTCAMLESILREAGFKTGLYTSPHIYDYTERIKINVGAALTDLGEDAPEDYIVHGPNRITALPMEVPVCYQEIAHCLEKSISRIETAVLNALENTPPELYADIVKNGIYLAGGGALLRGLDKRLNDKINIPFHIAEDPLHAVAKGTGIALKNVDRFSFLMR